MFQLQIKLNKILLFNTLDSGQLVSMKWTFCLIY